MRTRGSAAATFVVLGALLVACGAPDARYVKNTSAGIYMKLPSRWRVFDVQDGHPMGVKAIQPEGATAALGGGGGALENATPWQQAFDGSPDANRADLEAALPADPVGFVQVVPTEGLTIEHTLVGLRSIATSDGSDPLATPPDGVSVDDYQELEFPSGHWGIRITVTEDHADGKLRLTRIALFDAAAKRIFVVSVACSSTCYDRNQEAIDHVLDSLTLQDR